MIPVEMAFNPPFTKSVTFVFFNNIIDMMFFFDMCWMFSTSHLNQKGQEIFNSILIAKNYIKSVRFLFDFFAILGTRLVTNKFPGLKIFGIFKMSRILRLGSIIGKLNIPEDVKAMLNLFKLTFYLYLVIHVIGCSWYIVTSVNKDKVDADGRSL